jgi:hypothetical protein
MDRSIVLERDFLHVGCLPVFALHVNRYRISLLLFCSRLNDFTCPVLFFILFLIMSKSSIHADHFTNPNQQTQIVIHKICFL